jgi:predicted amidohydrolase
MKIAAGQMTVGFDKTDNLAKIADMSACAAKGGARLIVFPEAAMFNYGIARDQLVPHAESLDGRFVSELSAIAAANTMFIVAGMFEKIPDQDRVFNTVVVVDDAGKLVCAYRKIHLYDAFGWKESERIKPGDGKTVTFKCEDITFGVMTCYDLRFPELARHLASSGAQTLLLPAAWIAGPLKESHLEILLRARAIENNVYVLASTQVGTIYCAASMLADPMGVVAAAIGEEEGLLEAEISLDRVKSVRAKSPTLANCRPDVYQSWNLTPSTSPKR